MLLIHLPLLTPCYNLFSHIRHTGRHHLRSHTEYQSSTTDTLQYEILKCKFTESRVIKLGNCFRVCCRHMCPIVVLILLSCHGAQGHRLHSHTTNCVYPRVMQARVGWRGGLMSSSYHPIIHPVLMCRPNSIPICILSAFALPLIHYPQIGHTGQCVTQLKLLHGWVVIRC